MANFPRLDELEVAANSRGLFDGMLVYFDRENAKDLNFANGLHNLWAELLERTNERQLFITKLEGLRPSVKRYKILECLHKDVLYNRVNEMKMLSSELNLFGGPLAVQCAEYLKQLSQIEVLRMLELRRMIAEVHIQVHKKIDFLTVLRFY
ncbi:hypothetical protein Tco_0054134 [Tanacetum coccineum]